MRESFPSHSSSLSKANLVRGDPLLDGIRGVTITHRMPLGQLGNTDLWPFWLRSIGRQLRDAPSDGCRSSFALPGSRRFHILSCHSTPGRRGHIQSITDRPWLFRLSQCCGLLTLPYGWGDHDPAWPKGAAFPCSAFDTGGFRSALLHRQSCEFAPGHVRRPGLDCVPFWLEP